MFVFNRIAAAAVLASLTLVGLIVADFYTTWPHIQQLERVTTAAWVVCCVQVLIITLYRRLKAHIAAAVDVRVRTMLEAAGNTRVDIQCRLADMERRLMEAIESVVEDVTDLTQRHSHLRAAEAVLADRRAERHPQKVALVLGDGGTVHRLPGTDGADPHTPPSAS